LILSLIEAQPDLCDLIICDEPMKNVLGTPYLLVKNLENPDGSLDGNKAFEKVLNTIVNQYASFILINLFVGRGERD
jgi:hypothetical protein